jgi:hypothetical protein
MAHRTMRGEQVDITKYIDANAKAPALGNLSMNAGGDIIGPGGKIIKTRAAISKEYNQQNPNAVKQIGLKNLEAEIFSPAQAVDKMRGETVKPEAPQLDSSTDTKKRKIKDSED